MSHERNFNLLNSKFKELFFPTLIASIAGNFAILADAFIISLLMDSMYLSVVQSIEPLAAFVNMVYWVIGLGGSILCTRAKAEFDDEKGNVIFSVSMISIIIVGIIITLSGFLFHDAFIHALCHLDQIMPLVSQYFSWYILGVPFTCYMICLAYFIRTDGFIQLQFRAFLLNNVVNVVFDVILMEFFNMGIFGAAIATTLGAVTSAIYISTYFFDSKRTLKFIKVKSSKIMGNLADICKAGFSGASIPLYSTLKLLFLNDLITVILGEIGLAAFNMCYNTLFLVSIFIFGTTQSLLPIVAVYYNEEDYTGVEYVVKRALKIVAVFGLFFTLLFTIFPDSILILFNVKNTADIPFIMDAVRIFSLCILGYAINFLYIFYTQSVQYNRLSNAITLLEGFILPVSLSYMLTYFIGADGFWVSFALSEVITLLFIFLHSRYVNRKHGDEYSGFFLIKQNRKDSIFEFTIDGTKENAIAVSNDMHRFLSDSKLSDHACLALEEIIGHIIDINEQVDVMDIIIRDKKDVMVISIKYAGIGFNPIDDKDADAKIIDILDNIADHVDYSQILGLNNTVITIKH